MIGRLFCWIGIHRWVNVGDPWLSPNWDDPAGRYLRMQDQRCSRCDRRCISEIEPAARPQRKDD